MEAIASAMVYMMHHIRMWLSSDNEKAAAAAARPKKTSPVCSAASYIDPVSWEKGLCEYESESVV